MRFDDEPFDVAIQQGRAILNRSVRSWSDYSTDSGLNRQDAVVREGSYDLVGGIRIYPQFLA